MPRILISDPIDASAVEALRQAGLGPEVRTKQSPAQLAELIGGFEGLVVRSATKVTADLLRHALKLKAVVRGGVGLDNIDVEAAKARGIAVMNTPDASTNSVAEHALALLFALTRRIPDAHAAMVAGRWEKTAFDGTEVAGKTLGLVGLGRIGAAVAHKTLGLGCRVIANRRGVTAPLPPELVAQGVKVVDFWDLLGESDIISFHVPLTPETNGLMNAAAFAKARKGVLIINCSRGGIVDEPALAAAVRSGQVGGAALDVFAKEPLEPESPLRGLPNVILTPHLGASTREGQARVGQEVVRKLVEFFSASGR